MPAEFEPKFIREEGEGSSESKEEPSQEMPSGKLPEEKDFSAPETRRIAGAIRDLFEKNTNEISGLLLNAEGSGKEEDIKKAVALMRESLEAIDGLVNRGFRGREFQEKPRENWGNAPIFNLETEEPPKRSLKQKMKDFWEGNPKKGRQINVVQRGQVDPQFQESYQNQPRCEFKKSIHSSPDGKMNYYMPIESYGNFQLDWWGEKSGGTLAWGLENKGLAASEVAVIIEDQDHQALGVIVIPEGLNGKIKIPQEIVDKISFKEGIPFVDIYLKIFFKEKEKQAIE